MDKISESLIIKLYKNGSTYKEIASTFDVSTTTVWRIVNKYMTPEIYSNRSMSKERRKGTSNLSFYDKEFIIGMRKEGKSVSYICSKAKITRYTYYKLLEEKGLLCHKRWKTLYFQTH